MKSFRFALFTFIAIVTLSFNTQNAHADSYGMGGLTFVGNIDNSTYAPNGSIRVDGYIESNNPYSGGIPAYLTATTNGETKTVVPQQTVPAYGSTGLGQVTFRAPATPGSYFVSLGAAANLPAAQQVVDFAISIYGAGNACGNGVYGCVAASVSLAQPLSQSITLYVDDEYWDSGVNGPETVGFSFTIPAGQTEGYLITTIGRGGGSNTYLSSSGQYTGVNGTSTNLLLSGTLLNAYGNTKLRLTDASVSYFFDCQQQGGGSVCR